MSTRALEATGVAGKRAALVAGLGLVTSLIAAIADWPRFLQSWLLAYLFWIAFPLGAFGIAQIHHMTGGAWGRPVRASLEAAARTIPWLGVAFLPLALGLQQLYPWAREDLVARDPVLQHKEPWLNEAAFLGRAAGYLVLWSVLALAQDRLSRRRERDDEPGLGHLQRTLAAPAFALYALSMTFAAFDWAMSLEPHWFSSIYGLVFVVGQGLTALAGALLLLGWRSWNGRRDIDRDVLHDLGKLLFASVFLWGYVGYSQYLLIWSANLAEEVPWYLARSHGGWEVVAVALIALHFVLPFLLLLDRRVKRSPGALAALAALLLLLRWLDVAWYVLPAFHAPGLAVGWSDLAATAALGGSWTVLFLRALRGPSPTTAHPSNPARSVLSHESS